ncbi:MAG: glycosyltransferase family 39 protein [Planctomycetota bacterium]
MARGRRAASLGPSGGGPRGLPRGELLTPARAVAGLTAAGLLLRGAAAGRAAVLIRDGQGYLDVARLLRAGDLPGALGQHVPVAYPLLLVPAGGDPAAAAWLTAAASALAVPFAALSAGQRWGPRAAVWTAALVALWPLGIEVGSELLSDGPFVAWTLGAVACADRARLRGAGWALLAGALGVLAYFTRPEGLLVLGGIGLALCVSALRRRRLGLLAALGAPGLLGVGPYLLWIRRRAVLGGTQAGVWKLTLKRNLAERLSILTPSLVLRRAGQLAWFAGAALGPVGAALLAAGAWRRARGPRRPAGPWGLHLAVAALLVAAYLAIRVDPRYGLPLVGLAWPWLGRTAAELARDRRLRLGLLALLLVCASVATLRPRRADKAPLRAAGLALRELGARRVLAHDSRAAFYAGAQPEHLLLHVPDRADQTPTRVIALARELGVDAVVWEVHGPEDRDALRALAPVRARFGDPGEVQLELYWLAR